MDRKKKIGIGVLVAYVVVVIIFLVVYNVSKPKKTFQLPKSEKPFEAAKKSKVPKKSQPVVPVMSQEEVDAVKKAIKSGEPIPPQKKIEITPVIPPQPIREPRVSEVPPSPLMSPSMLSVFEDSKRAGDIYSTLPNNCSAIGDLLMGEFNVKTSKSQEAALKIDGLKVRMERIVGSSGENLEKAQAIKNLNNTAIADFKNTDFYGALSSRKILYLIRGLELCYENRLPQAAAGNASVQSRPSMVFGGDAQFKKGEVYVVRLKTVPLKTKIEGSEPRYIDWLRAAPVAKLQQDDEVEIIEDSTPRSPIVTVKSVQDGRMGQIPKTSIRKISK